MKEANLFPTPIALFDSVYTKPEEITNLALGQLEGLGTPKSWNCDIQSAFNVNMRFADQIPEFKDTILQAASKYSQKHWGKNAKIYESWANAARSGQYQERHDHIGSSSVRFCGVYYPQLGEGEKISFHTPFRTLAIFDSMKTITDINLKANRLIVFPVYLEHSFEPRERTVQKVSIAFNFVLG